MTFILPKLKYSFDAFEPYIDAKTMQIHYEKHHQAYIDKLNAAVQQEHEYISWDIEQIVTNIDKLPSSIQTAVRNNGGGHYNHSLFWNLLSPDKKKPSPKFSGLIAPKFGDYESFKNSFKEAALSRFGSGWVWLVLSNGIPTIVTTPNQDNPLMESESSELTLLLGLDVWEHAYYLQYQNRRGDYVDNWWNVVNWEEVEKRI